MDSDFQALYSNYKETKMNIKPINLPSEQGKPIIIAGPCSAENELQVLQTARRLSEIGIKVFRAGVWKPRTKPGCFEGRGAVALDWLKRVKEETGMLVATEVATPEHARLCLEAGVDVLWIGARTTTNPFAVQALADELRGSDVRVMVKNPVSPDVELWIGALERLSSAGVSRLAAVHRGFSAYNDKTFRNPPMWQLPIELRRRVPSLPIIGDPSHIGGQRELVYPLAQQALDLGFDGLMIESHINPEEALSDAKQQLMPDELQHLIDELVVRDRCNRGEQLTQLRQQIDQLDDQLISLLAQRMAVSREIGEYKNKQNMTVLQSARYNDILDRRAIQAEKHNLSPDFIKRIFACVHEESVRQQIMIVNN